MGEKEKITLLSCLGIIMTMICLIFEHIEEQVNHIVLWGSFIVFSISVGTKFLVNQYTRQKQYRLINLLAMCNICKLLILIIYFYFRTTSEYCSINEIEMIRILLEFVLVEFVENIMVLLASKYNQMGKKDILWIPCIAILGWITCRIMPINYIRNMIRIFSGINCLMLFYICYRWKGLTSKVFGKHKIYLRMFLFFGWVQYLLDIVIKSFYMNKHVTFVMLNLLQAICLLVYVYKSCLWEPWYKKIETLNNAEYTIKEQNKTCDMIISLSHELKTPVNVILSALEIMLLDYEEDQEILKQVKDIRKDCVEMMNIIQNMIDVQRIKGNHIQMKYQTYNLVEAVENVIDAFSRNMACSPFVFNPQEEEIYQEIDLGLLQQSFMLGFNLLMNQDPNSELYIEIGQMQDSKGTYMLIKHNALHCLKEMYYPISSRIKEGNPIAIGLTIQLVQLILLLHHTKTEYIDENEKTVMKIIFPQCTKVTDEWIDEENIGSLGEQIRARDMLVNL